MLIINAETKLFKTLHYGTVPAGWLPVPPRLEARATAYAPYCELVIEDGVLVDILPLPRPEPKPPEPTAQEILQAKVKLLEAKNAALSDQSDFQEELIVELANVVYA